MEITSLKKSETLKSGDFDKRKLKVKGSECEDFIVLLV